MIGQVTEVDEDGVPMALAHGEDGERRACLLHVPGPAAVLG